MADIEALVADITTLDVDAIVNAANQSLLGGGGVDGAIHRAAGPRLVEVCEAIPASDEGVRCPTGEAITTNAFALLARLVIHTVGPVWHGGDQGEDDLLRSCYESALREAHRHDARSVAFPAISTGVYAFPPERAARIAVDTVRATLTRTSSVQRVVFCCFDQNTLELYRRRLG
jgi:O-acetyl-ADP-ribose deacetylase